MSKMKWSQFRKGLELALNSKTTYAYGGFGWPLNDANKKRLLQNKDNAQFIKAINAGNINVFAFDCVCLIKAILWGWVANTKLNYGGAAYKANGVPDVNADQMMTAAHVTGLSTDFSKIKVGAFVGMKRHIGVYIGNGLVIECTPIWGAKVLTSKLTDRKWVNWGMSKYIDYSDVGNVVDAPKETDWILEPNYEIVLLQDIHERNECIADEKKATGTVLRNKGEVLKVNAYRHADGYLWRRLESGKVIATGPSTSVYDWATLRPVSSTPSIKVGSRVEVIKPVQYNGQPFNVWRNSYVVKEIKGDRVVITQNGIVHAAVELDNLKLI